MLSVSVHACFQLVYLVVTEYRSSADIRWVQPGKFPIDNSTLRDKLVPIRSFG